MHVTQILDKHLRSHCQGTHAKRMEAVLSMVNALLRGRSLTVNKWGQMKLYFHTIKGIGPFNPHFEPKE